MSNRPTKPIDRIEEGAMAFFLAFMTLLTFAQVVLRYGFNTGFVWSLEATVYAFCWLVIIGMAYGVRTGGHIAANILVSRFEGRNRQVLGLIATMLCLAYAGLLLYGSITLLERLMKLGHNARDLPVPRWFLTSILPIGFALLFYRLLEVAWQIFKGDREGPGGDNFGAVDGDLDLIDRTDEGASLSGASER
jgi:C4-dicarboxylate transporter, DctQ subunit